MRWQVMLAELSQPVMSREEALNHQRLLESLLEATESREERELRQEQAKEQFQRVMGFSFVRGVKVK